MECSGCGVWLNDVDGFDRCPVCGAKTGFIGKPKKAEIKESDSAKAAEPPKPKKPFFEQLKYDIFTQEVFLDKRPLEIWAFIVLVGFRLALTLVNYAVLVNILFGLASSDNNPVGWVVVLIAMAVGSVFVLAMAAIIWQAWIYKKRIFWGAFWFFFALSALGGYNQGTEDLAIGLSYIIAIALLAFLINTNFPKWVEEQRKKDAEKAKA